MLGFVGNEMSLCLGFLEVSPPLLPLLVLVVVVLPLVLLVVELRRQALDRVRPHVDDALDLRLHLRLVRHRVRKVVVDWKIKQF